MSDVAIVIATRHRARELAGTLRSLAAMDGSGLEWEVVVVNNGADPETRRVAVEAATELRLRCLDEPTAGKNRALNRALHTVHCALVAFTDDDVVVDRGWLTALWQGAARWPDASIFGGRILPQWPDGSPPADHALFDHAYAIADFAHGERAYSSGYVYGPNMAIRSRVFDEGWRFNEQVGPDGTHTYISGSETSLTVALEKAGHRAVYLPHALVHHQIRSEQLTNRWLYGRAFRRGRTEAYRKRMEGGWRHVPPQLFVNVAHELMQAVGCCGRGDHRGHLHHMLKYWAARGRVYHCCVTPRACEPGGRLAPRFGV